MVTTSYDRKLPIYPSYIYPPYFRYLDVFRQTFQQNFLKFGNGFQVFFNPNITVRPNIWNFRDFSYIILTELSIIW